MTIEEQYKCFIKNCTSSPNSVGNYSDFKRINGIIANIKGSDSFDIYSCTSTKDMQEIIDSLNANEDFKSYEKKGGNQYSNALKTYMRYLQAKELFTKTEDKEILENKNSLQQIYYGAPGTGKSNTIKRYTIGKDVIRTTFHPDTDYASFVGTYKPTTEEYPIRNAAGDIIKDENEQVITDERITYKFIPQVFLEAYCRAWKEPSKEHFLVIEEINRGNCAQIFGDLFQLLDRNTWGYSEYPIIADKDMRTYLSREFKNITIPEAEKLNAQFEGENIANKVKNGEVLVLPANMYIWATMNTSDQSLFPIDSAFKRRWDWKYMPICEGRDKDTNKPLKWYINCGTSQYDWWSFLEIINCKIDSITNSEDKKLGYFFCKAKNGEISADLFVSKVIFYLWNDVFKDYGFDDAIFQDEDGSRLEFHKFYEDVNGTITVKKNMVNYFLAQLGVKNITINTEEIDNNDFEEEKEELQNGQRDQSQYSINDNGSYKKGPLALNVLQEYINNNPFKNVQEVIDDWKSVMVNAPHMLETEEEFHSRINKSKDKRERAKSVKWNNDNILYMTTEWNIDTITEFIQKVNSQNWNITIQKVK